jgi:hypothetical protein
MAVDQLANRPCISQELACGKLACFLYASFPHGGSDLPGFHADGLLIELLHGLPRRLGEYRL